MHTYHGSHGGRIDVAGEAIVLQPSGADSRQHAFRSRSVLGVEYREATTLANGRLKVTYLTSDGSPVVTPQVTFTDGPGGEELRSVAAWLMGVSEYNEIHGAIPSPTQTREVIEDGRGLLRRWRDTGAAIREESHAERPQRDQRRAVARRQDHHQSRERDRGRTAAARKSSAAQQAAWDIRRRDLQQLLALAETGGHPEPEGPFVLRRGERAYAVIHNTQLVEPRPGPAHLPGESQGVSFRILKGISYRIGSSGGTHAQGDEQLSAIDVGSVLVSNQRVAFVGAEHTREWLFTKMIARSDDLSSGLVLMRVSNRQRTSGFRCGGCLAAHVGPRLDLALAVHAGERREHMAGLRESLRILEATGPDLGAVLPV